MKLTGKVHHIGAIEEVGSNNIKKQVIILETFDNPQYPQYLSIEAIKDKTEQFAKLKVGDSIEADINLNGRLWTDREGKLVSFNSLSLWKCAVTAAAPTYAPPVDLSAAPDDDDLPF